MNLHERINLREWFDRQVRAGYTFYPKGWIVRLPKDEISEQAFRCYGKSAVTLAQRSPFPVGRKSW